MKIKMHLALLAIMSLAAAGCGSDSPKVEKAAPEQHTQAAGFTGTVAETMNAASYTYVLLDTGKEKIWFAGPASDIKVGDKLTMPPGLEKTNFTSKTLNRTFEKIYFVDRMQEPSGDQSMQTMSLDKGMDGKSRISPHKPAGMTFAGVKKPVGGKTIAEIYAQKKALAGKPVSLRGKVVKFSEGIMGKNWAHLQDGTGAEGTNDLTVTTLGTAGVGDTVLVKGIIAVDRDFGYGYKYDVLLDNATITAQ